VWQTDGRPMSGDIGKVCGGVGGWVGMHIHTHTCLYIHTHTLTHTHAHTQGTAHPSIKLARKVLDILDAHELPGHVQLAGGTNAYTGILFCYFLF
jgi:hypothetical protein